jgi:sortase (surface protein transpeptidase)
MNLLKTLSKLNELAEQLKKHFESDESFRKKLENEGVRGRLEIEDVEILFLIRKKKEEKEAEG